MGWCDNCGQQKKTRRISIGGGGGVFLCDPCLRKEVAWRKEKNKELRKMWHGKPPKGVLFRTKYKIPRK